MKKRALLITGVAVWVMGTPALAADLSFPPPIPEPVLPMVETSNGGWYLRGDVGVGIEDYDGVNITFGTPPSVDFTRIQKSMNDKPIIGAGLGYQWNDFLRFDGTVDYRAANSFSFTLADDVAAPNQGFNIYNGNHSAIVGLLNAYYDVGNFWGVLPFIGAGIGYGYHQVTGFHDVGAGESAGGFGIAEPQSSGDLAWALHAGMDYEVNQNLKLEMSYRYLDQGTINLGDVTCFNSPGCTSDNFEMRDLASHDLRVGMRWTFGEAPPPPPPPMMEAPVVRKY
ncbi:MAG: outer membrane beta-barrel protein [Pseudomonadota bacterium]